MSFTIAARTMLTSTGMLDFPLLTVEDGHITALHTLAPLEFENIPATHRYAEGVLVPCYMDIHIHGCAGYDLMDPSPSAMRIISASLAQHGVGAYLPTTVTSPADETLAALSGLTKEIARADTGVSIGAIPLGIHLEGPFLSREKRGVHTAALLQAPSIPLFERFWQAAEGRILLMTLAPELPGALELIEYASSLGVRCSLGHSNATFDQAHQAFLAGAASATHTFNAMRRLDHRDPGVTALVLDEDRLFAEIIADGLHVDPAMVRLFFKAKGPDRTILVTDGISATGMPDGIYKLGDIEVEVIQGRCTANGAIAGSTLTLDQGVRNLMEFTGAALPLAVRAASHNPAKLLGKEHIWGSLETGRRADITVLSRAGEVLQTFVCGRPVGSDA